MSGERLQNIKMLFGKHIKSRKDKKLKMQRDFILKNLKPRKI